MENAIDLLILPPHCSDILQPLDVGVFAPLKRALAADTDSVSRIDPERISRAQWTAMYMRARQKAFSKRNIESGWRATGLEPLSPIIVLEKLNPPPDPTPLSPHTPGNSSSLDLSLLHSSPPDGTELRQANAALDSELRKIKEVISPIKRYVDGLTKTSEVTQSELVNIRRQLAETQELLRPRKIRKRGKKVALKDRFVYSTQEVLQIAQQADDQAATKAGRKRRQESSVVPEVVGDKDDVSEIEYSDPESDGIVVASRNWCN